MTRWVALAAGISILAIMQPTGVAEVLPVEVSCECARASGKGLAFELRLVDGDSDPELELCLKNCAESPSTVYVPAIELFRGHQDTREIPERQITPDLVVMGPFPYLTSITYRKFVDASNVNRGSDAGTVLGRHQALVLRRPLLDCFDATVPAGWYYLSVSYSIPDVGGDAGGGEDETTYSSDGIWFQIAASGMQLAGSCKSDSENEKGVAIRLEAVRGDGDQEIEIAITNCGEELLVFMDSDLRLVLAASESRGRIKRWSSNTLTVMGPFPDLSAFATLDRVERFDGSNRGANTEEVIAPGDTRTLKWRSSSILPDDPLPGWYMLQAVYTIAAMETSKGARVSQRTRFLSNVLWFEVRSDQTFHVCD